jgi:hypothetical protein
MNLRLFEQFGIAADETYQYDRETRTVFKLQLKDGVDPQAPIEPGTRAEQLFDKADHMVLQDDGTETEFIRLVSAKKLTANELEVLQLLLKEKNMELQKVHASLEERFAISPEKHYEYDADAHTLFEVVKAGLSPSGDLPVAP